VLGATLEIALVPAPTRTEPLVRVVAPVPPLATGNVPVTPVVIGSPVQLVSVPDEGVPNTGVVKVGVVKVGLVKVLLVRVCTDVVPTKSPVEFGNVIVAVTVSAATNVVEPDVAPAITSGIM
jgi:hypothetical protein